MIRDAPRYSNALLTPTVVTERARKLRANYNLHAQSLRTRIEIRVNRIPTSLRRMKMGDLLAKCSEDQQKKAARAVANRGPPVPEKDILPARAPASRPATAPTSTRYANQMRYASRPFSLNHMLIRV